jgi:hypothetical protein
MWSGVDDSWPHPRGLEHYRDGAKRGDTAVKLPDTFLVWVPAAAARHAGTQQLVRLLHHAVNLVASIIGACIDVGI